MNLGEVRVVTGNEDIYTSEDIFADPVVWTKLSGEALEEALEVYRRVRERNDPIEFVPWNKPTI